MDGVKQIFRNAVVLGLFFVTSLIAQDNEALDYKADFIAQLPDYVTWPDGKATNAAGEIVIKVIGETPLTPMLTQKASSSSHKIVVKTVDMSDDLADCQIVFFPTQETSELAQILKKVNGKPILTVSECHYFARYGVMVNFVTEENGSKSKVKFEVNRTTLGEADLKMSSKLLKLATII